MSIIDKVRNHTGRATHRTLADLLRRLNPVLRGWCNYLLHGVSLRAVGNVDHYAYLRIFRWLRKRHPRLNIHTSCDASCPAGRSAPTVARGSASPTPSSGAAASWAPASPLHGRALAERRP